MKKILTLLLIAMTVMNPLTAHTADAPVVPIQQLKTPSGMTVWLVESHTLPMVSIETAFGAGAMYDPQGKEGLANFTAAMLTQGGSNGLSSDDFLKKTERLGVGISADADRQTISVGMQALSETIDEAFALYAATITAPEFYQKDFDRVKEAFLSSRKRIQENPSKLADEAFDKLVYGRYHPYAHPVIGSDYSLPKLTRKDVVKYYEDMFGRKNMYVSIVGDITPEKAIELVEKHFSKLPKGKTFKAPDAPKQQPPVLQKVTLDVPQTSIIMGHKGLSRKNDDYFAALLMNHIFGSGGFSSILMEEVREKRGLAYGIYSFFEPFPHWGAFQISVKTKNETAYKVVELVKEETQKIIDNGVTEEAYNEAMDYMIGSFPLRLDSNNDILSYLTFMQVENLGADYLDKWLANMRKVSQADVHAAAKRYLKPADMIVVMVGQPDAKPAPQKPAKETPKPAKPEAAAPKAVAAPAVVKKPVPEAAIAEPVKPAAKPVKVAPEPIMADEPIAEDILVEEESVSAKVTTANPEVAEATKPITVVPNPNAGKIIIPDDPAKLQAAEKAREEKAPKTAAKPTAPAAPKAKKPDTSISLEGMQIVKDPIKTKPRTRRNVNADEWL